MARIVLTPADIRFSLKMATRHLGRSIDLQLQHRDPVKRDNARALLLETVALWLDKLEVVRIVDLDASDFRNMCGRGPARNDPPAR